MRNVKNISFYALNVKDAIASLESDQAKGLSTHEVIERKNVFGQNSIAQAEKRSVFSVFLNQFKSPIVVLLLIAAGLSFAFGDWIDAIGVDFILKTVAGE